MVFLSETHRKMGFCGLFQNFLCQKYVVTPQNLPSCKYNEQSLMLMCINSQQTLASVVAFDKVEALPARTGEPARLVHADLPLALVTVISVAHGVGRVTLINI